MSPIPFGLIQKLENQELFDTVTLHRDQLSYRFFCSPIGYPTGLCPQCQPGSKRYKDETDTNLLMCGKCDIPLDGVMRVIEPLGFFGVQLLFQAIYESGLRIRATLHGNLYKEVN